MATVYKQGTFFLHFHRKVGGHSILVRFFVCKLRKNLCCAKKWEGDVPVYPVPTCIENGSLEWMINSSYTLIHKIPGSKLCDSNIKTHTISFDETFNQR